MKRAVFPGSFDPITVGHYSIIKRALPLFDEIIVAVGNNASKKTMYSISERIDFISKCFEGESKIKIKSFDGLTVDFCIAEDADYILRGLRTSRDFEFERGIGQVNKILNRNIETIFMLTATQHTPISSSIARDVIKHKGDVSELVPDAIIDEIRSKY